MPVTPNEPGAPAAAAVSRRSVLGLAAAAGAGAALGSLPTGTAVAAEASPGFRLPSRGELVRTYTPTCGCSTRRSGPTRR